MKQARMTPRRPITTLLLLLLAGPALAGNTTAFNPWIPKGWKLLTSATGDLNQDGIDDAVLVLEETNRKNLRKNDNLGAPELNLNPRRLLVLFGKPDGYQKILSRDRILPSEHNAESTCLADPLMESGGISITGGKLIIELGMWLSCGSWGVSQEKYTLRYENERFRLIGADYRDSTRNTGEASETSINFLTGKIKYTHGMNDFEPALDKPKVKWKKLTDPRPRYLDEISFNCNSKEEPGCGWAQ